MTFRPPAITHRRPAAAGHHHDAAGKLFLRTFLANSKNAPCGPIYPTYYFTLLHAPPSPPPTSAATATTPITTTPPQPPTMGVCGLNIHHSTPPPSQEIRHLQGAFVILFTRYRKRVLNRKAGLFVLGYKQERGAVG
ncbi:hypothetical protein Tco_1203551 [Tanacetum coccineum]